MSMCYINSAEPKPPECASPVIARYARTAQQLMRQDDTSFADASMLVATAEPDLEISRLNAMMDVAKTAANRTLIQNDFPVCAFEILNTKSHNDLHDAAAHVAFGSTAVAMYRHHTKVFTAVNHLADAAHSAHLAQQAAEQDPADLEPCSHCGRPGQPQFPQPAQSITIHSTNAADLLAQACQLMDQSDATPIELHRSILAAAITVRSPHQTHQHA